MRCTGTDRKIQADVEKFMEADPLSPCVIGFYNEDTDNEVRCRWCCRSPMYKFSAKLRPFKLLQTFFVFVECSMPTCCGAVRVAFDGVRRNSCKPRLYS